jgi:hypothetical protein
VFKNRVLRRIFGPRRVQVTCEWKLMQTLRCASEQSKKIEMFGARGTYRRQGMHTEFWWGDLME